MSVILQCPNCHQTAQFYRRPIENCPRCQAPYPGVIRQPAESALQRDLAPKPALLLLGQIVTTFGGGVFLLLLVLAPFNAASYSINGQPLSGHEFLRAGGGYTFALIGIWLTAIAVGLWRERAWARPFMLAYWPITEALVVAQSWHEPDFVTSVVSTGLFTIAGFAVAAWYLYDKENVVAYFASRARVVDKQV